MCTEYLIIIIRNSVYWMNAKLCMLLKLKQ